ncbi:hypothetical protein Ae201684_009442 [Aphanomyces euteiches]|uniref:Uncharacterized protein n=1 Tax=Aphanomyces euteiches TaxID=100861 RepID=A0A6G0X271_9STRA|nr:hypothetical protein Ae201684_009442 [Aphanomyces euteiches]
MTGRKSLYPQRATKRPVTIAMTATTLGPTLMPLADSNKSCTLHRKALKEERERQERDRNAVLHVVG